MNVCVFCSASDLADKYVLPAGQMAKLIAEGHGHSLVWGGSNSGVMKVMADGVQAGGGQDLRYLGGDPEAEGAAVMPTKW